MAAPAELRLADILRIEDSAEVVEIRCPDTGIPLWPMIRIELTRMLLGDLLYGGPVVGAGGVRSPLDMGAAWTIARSFAHNAYVLRSAAVDRPVLILSSGARLIKRDGGYFNTLSDHFVSVDPARTLAVEDLFGWHWPFPRVQGDVLLKTPLLVDGAIRGRLRLARYRSLARDVVDLLSRRVREFMGSNIDEHRRRRLAQLCAARSASLLPRYNAYVRLIERHKVKLMIKEEACYGGPDNASAMLAARNLGVVSAEYQHGAVSSGHDAYNFAPAVAQSAAYRQTLPDYFLAYGSWWADQIDAPIRKLPIGNPHRAESVRPIEQPSSRERVLLVLGDGIETDHYIGLCHEVAAAAGPSYRILFRPHPLERAGVRARYPSGDAGGGVSVDTNDDIYTSFRSVDAIVSEVSTGLFEAIGLVPRIFIWDTSKSRFSYPSHPFDRFVEASELSALLRDADSGRVSTGQVDAIWAPSWRERYRAFVESVLLRSSAYANGAPER